MKVCPKCSRQYPDESVFCPEDGARLTAPTTQVPLQLDPTRPPRPDHLARYRRMVGQTLDSRYRIEELLGEGGMGVVFRATHTVIEKPVAIKLLKREVAQHDEGEQITARFLQEAKAASRINHPNLVDVSDFGTLPDGSAYFVMEYISGRTLAKVIKEENPLQTGRVLTFVAQLARALGAAHKRGVVHRDLKPENIFVMDRAGEGELIKIVDFGIAKLVPDEGHPATGPRLTRVGSVFGTPEYMAPEQAAGRTDIDHRVDIYALGTIFYELLTGHVPFENDNVVAVLAMQMLDPIPPPSQAYPQARVDPGIESVLMRALSKERESRYASMADFLAALEAAVGEAFPGDAPSSSSIATLRRMETSGAHDLAALARGEPGPPPPVHHQPLGPQTIRTAGPDDRTYAPDPNLISPFYRQATLDQANTAVPPPPDAAKPLPLTPPPPTVPPGAAPRPVHPEHTPPLGPRAGKAQPDPPRRQVRKPATTSKHPPLAMGPPPPAPPLVPPGAVAQGVPDRALDVPGTEKISRHRLAEPLPGDRPAGRSRAWLWVTIVGLALIAGGLAAWRLWASKPAAVAVVTPDAAPPTTVIIDAGTPLVLDAAPPAPPDAGPVKKTPGKPISKKPPAFTYPPQDPTADVIGSGAPVTVTVFVSPASGQLRGLGGAVIPSGTAVQQPGGSRVTFTCKADNYRPGRVQVKFDGSMRSATCQLCSLELKYEAGHPCAR